MTSLLLATVIAIPSYNLRTNLNNGQVRRKAHQIVQLLRRQDPEVLRSVMYYMGWVPKVEYKKKCKKVTKQPEDPVMDMLLNEAGIKRR